MVPDLRLGEDSEIGFREACYLNSLGDPVDLLLPPNYPVAFYFGPLIIVVAYMRLNISWGNKWAQCPREHLDEGEYQACNIRLLIVHQTKPWKIDHRSNILGTELGVFKVGNRHARMVNCVLAGKPGAR